MLIGTNLEKAQQSITYALANAQFLVKQKAVDENPLIATMLEDIITAIDDADKRLWKIRQEFRKWEQR